MHIFNIIKKIFFKNTKEYTSIRLVTQSFSSNSSKIYIYLLVPLILLGRMLNNFDPRKRMIFIKKGILNFRLVKRPSDAARAQCTDYIEHPPPFRL